MYAGVEIGGTKVVIAYGTCPEDLSDMVRIPTTTPQETATLIVSRLKAIDTTFGRLKGIGIASFGPIGVSPGLSGYGVIQNTPKPGWSQFDLLGAISQAFPEVRVVVETDVGAAALAEAQWGGAQGMQTIAYVTAGTGIGAGILVDGKPVHGRLHPEVGHILVRRDPRDHDFAGCCPFHGDCLEGMAAGPSLFARTQLHGEEIATDSPVWMIVGGYLGQLYYSLALTVAPQRILVGGSLGLRDDVLHASRDSLLRLASGYIGFLSDQKSVDDFVVKAQLGDRAGVLGALALVLPSGPARGTFVQGS